MWLIYFSANFSENCIVADSGRPWGQQREIQNCAGLLVQLSIHCFYLHPLAQPVSSESQSQRVGSDMELPVPASCFEIQYLVGARRGQINKGRRNEFEKVHVQHLPLEKITI